MFGKDIQTKNKFNIMNFDIPAENSLLTKYMQLLNIRKKMSTEFSQAIIKLADKGKDVS